MNNHLVHSKLRTLIKKFEFWNPRVFELPFYIYLGGLCLIKGVSIRTFAKANYALDHGEIGIGSKLESQLAFNQDYFLPSEKVSESLSSQDKQELIHQFIQKHDYPAILKSDVGCVGKGIVKLNSAEDVSKNAPLLLGDFILQKFTPFPYECGIFYTRYKTKPRITGINQKHFPCVNGNGTDDVLTLAKQHPRYTAHWNAFLQDIDTSEVLEDGKEKRISFIGSHTLGCKFTDDRHLLTPELENAIFKLFEQQPGFNYGRIDVKAADEAALQRGDFVVIEVNGIASLPTHMYDPKHSIFDAYKIFFEHAGHLVRIAKEHQHKPMQLLPYKDVIARVKYNQKMLNKVHQRLMGN